MVLVGKSILESKNEYSFYGFNSKEMQGKISINARRFLAESC